MSNTSTQEPRTIGSPNRFVLDQQGNVEWYDTLTLCLERADGVIDLALCYEQGKSVPSGTRPGTVSAALQSAQQELDDIRHVLRQWHKAGLPEECESDAGASGAAVNDIPAQTDIPAHYRHEYAEKMQKSFNEAFHVLRSQYGIMREFGGNTAPPAGGLDAETVQSIGISGDKAAYVVNDAFYGLMELYNYRHEEEAQS